MTSAVQTQTYPDATDIPTVFRRVLTLGVIEIVFAVVFSFTMRFTSGVVELAVCGAILLAGLYILSTLPGQWVGARSIEGISTAAGIGLGAALIFMVYDVLPFIGGQDLGIWTNRWREIGGGSNWWHHPIWWQVGAYVPWMGAFAMSNETAKTGAPNAIKVFALSVILGIVLMFAATLVHVPKATLGLGSFAVAFLVAQGLVVGITAIGVPKKS